MIISPEKTILDYFFYEQEQRKPYALFLRQPEGSGFRDYTWQDTGRIVRKLAAFLKKLPLPAGSLIGLVSKNCAEWIMADLSIMMAGHISVPFYPTLTGQQLRQVLEHSGCQYIFTGKLDDPEGTKAGIPEGATCISFPYYNPDPEHIQWNDILSSEEEMAENYRPALQDIFTIIYTSGTTGQPKGVMHTYKAMAEALYHTREASGIDLPETRFFSYLPLCHIAERNIVESIGIASGGTIYFAENLDTFNENLQKAAPTHFLAVPRIWMKFRQGILGKISQKKLDLLLSLPVIRHLIRTKIRKGLGLHKAVLVVTGAAPMPPDLIRWFRKLGIQIMEAYGMTENLGAVSLMPGQKVKDGSVGRLYPAVEVRIQETTGEILTRSPWNMTGYYKEPEMTLETLDAEGWIHTGDVGLLDQENYLTITGRVKEIFKTSKGEYIAPAGIEAGLSSNPLIEQVCVTGEGLPQPLALITLSDQAGNLSREQLSYELSQLLNVVNQTLKTYERINKIVVLKEAWTVENNRLTPTFKTRRNAIEKEFKGNFAHWSEEKAAVLFE